MDVTENAKMVANDLAEDLVEMERHVVYGYTGLVADYARDWQKRLARIVSVHQPIEEAGTIWCEGCGFAWPCHTIRLAGGEQL